jgi:hypothetical protein
MAIYIANVNGDWWEYHPEHPLYVLDTDNLNDVQISEIEDNWGSIGADKFEQVIMQYGETVSLRKESN